MHCTTLDSVTALRVRVLVSPPSVVTPVVILTPSFLHVMVSLPVHVKVAEWPNRMVVRSGCW